MLCKGRSFTYGGFILTDEEEKYTIEIKKDEEYKPVPWKSALYSLIFPGLGQIYNGEIGRGSYYFVIAFMLIVAAYLVIPIVIYIIFWLYSIYQAFNYARNIHKKSKDH